MPTLADPSLAPEGRHVLIFTTLVSYEAAGRWQSEKDAMTERIFEMAGRQLPDLRERICFHESATPRTMERYTRNQAGALYGWEVSPGQVGPGRLGSDTPIDGLHLVGHWTQPGGGVYGVVSSGVHVARSVLGVASEAELLALR